MRLSLHPSRGRWGVAPVVSVALLALRSVQALDLTIGDLESEKKAAATAAKNMMSYYHGDEPGQNPGKLPDTWWEGGAMFMTLIQYWFLTGDDQYNESINRGMQHQAGEDANYMPSNASAYLGNDDQVFWALAAMTAAEDVYPDVPDKPSWLALAQAVFNTQVARWDTKTCDGGLRWQMHPYQSGYHLKNSVSNGGLFALSARLARYTNNETYGEWADKIWDWSVKSPLVDPKTWSIADTTDANTDCSDKGNLQWSYNYGLYLNGASYMYDWKNQDPEWGKRIDGLLNAIFAMFFPNKPEYGNGNVFVEVTCEPQDLCDRNQKLFKGFVTMWMALTTLFDPATKDKIQGKLHSTAASAAKQCSGEGTNKCGMEWYQPSYDGPSTLETEMSALALFSSLLVKDEGLTPATAEDGGKSASDPGAGGGTTAKPPPGLTSPITTGDKVGASFLTLFFIIGWGALMAWMVTF